MEIDLTFIFTNVIPWLNAFANQLVIDFTNPDPWVSVNLFLFKYQGWLIYLYIVIRYLLYPEYMLYIGNRWYDKNIKMVFLAIDVPKRNEQSIQAMENFFDHLLGAHGTFNWWATYIEGEFQLSFSCELISIEGNIQFLIRTPKHLRNLVEAAIYGQFPDAEITEVQDYTGSVPRYYPNETHDIYGLEMSLSNKNVYLPIKTAEKFEHRFSETFVDPMAALLETMSQIGPGEQIWIQYLIKPLEVGWGREGGQKEIDKILGKKPTPKPSMLGKGFDMLLSIISGFTEQTIGVTFNPEEAATEKKDEQFKIMNLTPGQKDQLDAISRKISKLAYDTKIRYIYIAEKGKMNKAIGVNGVIGAFKQWTDMNANGIRPMMTETSTNAPQYVLIEKRRNRRRNLIMGAYRRRDTVMGIPAKPMSSEELASLWHFPGMDVKAPFVKATAFKKAAAPVGLPIESKLPEAVESKKVEEVAVEEARTVPTFDYDNDDFEKQFAVDKEEFAKTRPMRKEKLKQVEAEDAAKEKETKKTAAKKTKTVRKEAQEEASAQPVANLIQQKEDVREQKAPMQNKAADEEDEEKDTKSTPGNLPFID